MGNRYWLNFADPLNANSLERAATLGGNLYPRSPPSLLQLGGSFDDRPLTYLNLGETNYISWISRTLKFKLGHLEMKCLTWTISCSAEKWSFSRWTRLFVLPSNFSLGIADQIPPIKWRNLEFVLILLPSLPFPYMPLLEAEMASLTIACRISSRGSTKLLATPPSFGLYSQGCCTIGFVLHANRRLLRDTRIGFALPEGE